MAIDTTKYPKEKKLDGVKNPEGLKLHEIFCVKCRKLLSDGWVFCPTCGEKVKPISDTSQKTSFNSYLNLTEKDLEQAIEIGRRGKTEYFKFTEQYYLPLKEKKNMRKSVNVQVNTVYSHIAGESMLANHQLRTYDLADAKQSVENLKELNQIMFSVFLKGLNIQFHHHSAVVIEQDGVYIQPLYIENMDGYANYVESGNYSLYCYEIIVLPYFDISKIDFTKLANLVVSNNFEKVVFEVDFTVYK